jgi:hypothetical protein
LADAQVERLIAPIDESEEDLSSASSALDRMLKLGYSPAEVVVELGKCILGMLHFRVLSWA